MEGASVYFKAQLVAALGGLRSQEASAETPTPGLAPAELRRTALPLAFPFGFEEPLLWLCVLGATAAWRLSFCCTPAAAPSSAIQLL
jgi:hypothetical protein